MYMLCSRRCIVVTIDGASYDVDVDVYIYIYIRLAYN
jgi:hypothetical protein